MADEEEYNKFIQRLFSDDFFNKLISKRVAGQDDDDDPEDWWKSYTFMTNQVQPKDYTGIKDGFSQFYVTKYLWPRIQRVATEDDAKLWKQIWQYDFEIEQDEDRYSSLSNLEIAVEDISALVFDWNLRYHESKDWNQRKAAVMWLFSEIMENPKEWGDFEKNTDSGFRAGEIDEWMESVDEIINNSWIKQGDTKVNRARLKGYHTLLKVDLMMVKDVVETYYNWKGETNLNALFSSEGDEKHMDVLFTNILLTTDRIEDEIWGDNEYRQGHGIEKYLNFDAGERGKLRFTIENQGE